jgi:hypothetical protein
MINKAKQNKTIWMIGSGQNQQNKTLKIEQNSGNMSFIVNTVFCIHDLKNQDEIQGTIR